MWTNFHSHSHYCDGKFPIEVHIQAAIKKGFYAFGCSSHAPVDFDNHWSMDLADLPQYVTEIRQLQQTYADRIQIFAGLEVDYIPGSIGPHSPVILEAKLDYTVGSVHFVDKFDNGEHWGIDGTRTHFLEGLSTIWKGDIEAAVRRYYELIRHMVHEDCPDIIGHIDKIKMHNLDDSLFQESEDWYREAVAETLETIQQKGVIVEVNTRGMYKKGLFEPYPSYWFLEEIHQRKIPISLNSDSHHPREIDGEFHALAPILYEIGFRELSILDKKGWRAVPFDATGILL